MKKLILAAVFIFGGLTTISAQTKPADKTESTTKTTTTQTTPDATPAATQEYTDVKVDVLPEAIKTAVSAAYPGAVINSAQVNSGNEYKLNLTVGDQTGVVYSDANGKWIKK
ncbi:MAG TPA: hypothetical protein VK623_06600 [Flavobacterium sp.]|nr:hypothetical protein [Flavobacterium sp.]